MRSTFIKATGIVACFAWAGSAQAQQWQAPSLLPMPQYVADNNPFPAQAAGQPVNYGGELAPTPAPIPESSPSDLPSSAVPPSAINIAPATEGCETPALEGCSPYLDAAASNWGGGQCAGGMCCPRGPGIFGGVYGLIMTRDRANFISTSYVDEDCFCSELNNYDVSVGWQGGIEARLGYACCNSWAFEAVYWGIFPANYCASVCADEVGGTLNTTFDVGGLSYNNGYGTDAPLTDYWDNAQVHKVWRSFSVNNIELNLLHLPVCCTPGGIFGGRGPSLNVGFTTGARALLINETFGFAADCEDPYIDGTANEVCYDISVNNTLIGWQLGGYSELCVSKCISLYSDVKFGIFGNSISSQQGIGGNNGYAYINDGPYAGDEYKTCSQEGAVSFLGEIRLGVSVQLSCNWRATCGYRAVGITGVALPEDQIPYYLTDLKDANRVNTNGSMILHGVQAGVEFCF